MLQIPRPAIQLATLRASYTHSTGVEFMCIVFYTDGVPACKTWHHCWYIGRGWNSWEQARKCGQKDFLLKVCTAHSVKQLAKGIVMRNCAYMR